jgi:hypothetical protein
MWALWIPASAGMTNSRHAAWNEPPSGFKKAMEPYLPLDVIYR